jgi:hypothetical protein
MRYFLPHEPDAVYLVQALNNQTRESWFTPPYYAIVLIGEIFVVSKYWQIKPPNTVGSDFREKIGCKWGSSLAF